jgi:hypothetical protein
MDSKKIIERLAEKNLFLCSYGENQMCVKNFKDEIVISFPLIPETDTLTCLRIRIDELRMILNLQ